MLCPSLCFRRFNAIRLCLGSKVFKPILRLDLRAPLNRKLMIFIGPFRHVYSNIAQITIMIEFSNFITISMSIAGPPSITNSPSSWWRTFATSLCSATASTRVRCKKMQFCFIWAFLLNWKSHSRSINNQLIDLIGIERRINSTWNELGRNNTP